MPLITSMLIFVWSIVSVLYVSGFASNLRAKDLAYEFERYGRLIRCDIPALKTPTSSPFAFVEFRREDDAEDAYYDMHGRSIDGRKITVQWAKRPPSSQWRHDGTSGYGDSRDRRRSPPPRRRSPSPPPRRRSPSPPPRRRSPSPRESRRGDYDDDDRVKEKDYAGSKRGRSASPERNGRDRSASPPPKRRESRDDRSRNGDDSLSPVKRSDRDDERERRDD
ncbi:hypothetical protein I302_100745 [Kwoniella bestiolae CBS 10118]|uniref:RRM domain-containing protein n=1 Tax=Kwoniella bestiolae CBS 10118 TaxID=1296100 RepID=A0A1B9G5Z4_9TREE|nr:hypothetical protein I302_04118 [Kwoniella bestiolae CBS 10118]OCF26433.1 hypothetical protein I302_04118 [Kwoniella bestiolae CBS 10118]